MRQTVQEESFLKIQLWQKKECVFNCVLMHTLRYQMRFKFKIKANFSNEVHTTKSIILNSVF